MRYEILIQSNRDQFWLFFFPSNEGPKVNETHTCGHVNRAYQSEGVRMGYRGCTPPPKRNVEVPVFRQSSFHIRIESELSVISILYLGNYFFSSNKLKCHAIMPGRHAYNGSNNKEWA